MKLPTPPFLDLDKIPTIGKNQVFGYLRINDQVIFIGKSQFKSGVENSHSKAMTPSINQDRYSLPKESINNQVHKFIRASLGGILSKKRENTYCLRIMGVVHL